MTVSKWQKFQLRHSVLIFAIIGLLAVVVAMVATWWLISRTTHASVIRSTEASNFALTEVFANEVWGDIRTLLPPPEEGADGARNNPFLLGLDSRIRYFGHGTDVVKVKLYSLNGITAYSSELKQIGEDKSKNEGFRSALGGRPLTELSFRGHFNAFDGEVHDRNLVSTYVPLRAEGQIVAVVEIYTDRTTSIEAADAELAKLLSYIVPIFLAVYGVLLSIVARSDRIRHEHEVSLERLAEENAEARRQADQANQVKSQFLATMSHEIRTPMSGVIGLSNLLLETPLADDQRELVRNVISSGESLLVIINDILDLSKIEAGRMEFDFQPFVLDSVAEDILALFKVRAGEKGIRLYLDIEPAAQGWYVGDQLRIRQVLLNLVGNGVKFTDAGAVTVEVKRLADGVRFSVTDTGIGIPADAIGRLFASFTQVDASTTRRFGGTGLGLAISKSLVEGMGGRIGVDSEEGRGSCFWFELPLQPTAAPATSEPSANEASPVAGEAVAPGERWLLLAEDNAVNQLLATKLLGRLGFTVDVATNGREAVRAAAAKPYLLILMDMQMPEMDGLEATRLIRSQSGHNARVPIIALTANAMQSDRDACFAAGMNDFLSKPFNRDELAACLQQWLSAG